MSADGSFPLRLLIFMAGEGIFGARADQITSTSTYDAQDNDPELLWFEREIGCRTLSLAPRVVVALRQGQGGPRRMVIGEMKDMVEIEAGEVRPMPALIERRTLPKGMWGVLARREGLCILVDLNRLAGR